MGTVYDDLPTHEGYTIDHHDGHLGACSCGWQDDQPAADLDAAVDRWDQHHAGPLLERAVPRQLADTIDAAERGLAELVRVRPHAALEVLDRLDRRLIQLRAAVSDAPDRQPTVADRLAAFGDPRSPRRAER